MTQQAVKMKLKPLGNRVLAKRKEAEEQAKGGIILPDSAKTKQETATVIAVGPGKDGKEMPVREGDTILMDRYGSQEVTIEDEEFVIVRAEDIVAIIE